MVLTSGTVIAQAISYAVTPLLTQFFYTPEDFGELAMYIRITAFITVIATARYELTIPLEKKDSHAFQLFWLSLRIAFWTIVATILIGAIYWVFSGVKTDTLFYLLLIIAGSAFMIFRNIASNWAIRKENFKVISYSKILHSSTANGLKLVAGLLNFGAIGLIIATVIGVIVSCTSFLKNFFNVSRSEENNRSGAKMKVLSRQYREFPRVNLPHSLLDHGRELLIAFFMIEFFTESVFGSYDLSFRMLRLPLMLIGTSIGQVFFQKASKMYAEKRKMYPTLKKTVALLSALSLIPFSIVFFFGEPIFVFVFGDNWVLAGQIAEILAPWLMINLVTSPISTLPLVFKKQVLFFWLGLVSTIIQVIGFGILPILQLKGYFDIISMFYIISLSMTFYLVIVTIIKFRLTLNYDRNQAVEN
ncbi:lipopolysaccharide biosynthesis protein [Halocola ammonii]